MSTVPHPDGGYTDRVTGVTKLHYGPTTVDPDKHHVMYSDWTVSPPGWSKQASADDGRERTWVIAEEELKRCLESVKSPGLQYPADPHLEKQDAFAVLSGALTNHSIASDLASIPGAIEIIRMDAEMIPPNEWTNNCKNLLYKMDHKMFPNYKDAYWNRVQTNKDMGHTGPIIPVVPPPEPGLGSAHANLPPLSM